MEVNKNQMVVNICYIGKRPYDINLQAK